MELGDDGPIIMDECCLNCIHSVERKNGIACGDRGILLSLIMGLRQIERPNIEKCNRFDPIPTQIEPQCKDCTHYDIHCGDPVCYDISLGQFFVFGPRPTCPTGKCENFALHKIYQPRKYNGR